MSIKNLLSDNTKTWANLKINSLIFPNGEMEYLETTVDIPFSFGGNIVQVLIKFIRIGNLISIQLPRTIATMNITDIIENTTPIPSEFRPITRVRNITGVLSFSDVNSVGSIFLDADGIIRITLGSGFGPFPSGVGKGWPSAIVLTFDRSSPGTDGVISDVFQQSFNSILVDEINEFTLDSGVTIEQNIFFDGCAQINCLQPLLFPNEPLLMIKTASSDVEQQLEFIGPDNDLGSNSIWYHISNDLDPDNSSNTYAGLGPVFKMGASQVAGDTFSQIGEAIQIYGNPESSVLQMSTTNFALGEVRPFSLNLKVNQNGAGIFDNLLINSNELRFRTYNEGFAGDDVLNINDNFGIINRHLTINSGNVAPNTTPGADVDIGIYKINDVTLLLAANIDNVGGLDSPEFWMTNNGITNPTGIKDLIDVFGDYFSTTSGDMVFRTGATFNAFALGDRPTLNTAGTDAMLMKSSDSKVQIPIGLETNLIENLSIGDINITNNDAGNIILNSVTGNVQIEGITMSGTTMNVDQISEATGANSVTFPNDLKTDIIEELTGTVGVTIDGVLLKDNSILFSGGQTALDHYEEALHITDLTGIWAADIVGVNFRLIRIGRIVTLSSLGIATATANAASVITFVTVIPANFRPNVTTIVFYPVINNAGDNLGQVTVDSAGNVTIAGNVVGISFTGSGNSGIVPGTATWTI